MVKSSLKRSIPLIRGSSNRVIAYYSLRAIGFLSRSFCSSKVANYSIEKEGPAYYAACGLGTTNGTAKGRLGSFSISAPRTACSSTFSCSYI